MTTTANTRSRRWFAAWYPAFMGRIERNGQATLRHDQLATAAGRVLEIGSGSGLSVPHYPAGLDELVLLEPNPAFRTQLRDRVRELPVTVSILDGDARQLPFPDSRSTPWPRRWCSARSTIRTGRCGRCTGCCGPAAGSCSTSTSGVARSAAWCKTC